MGARPRRATGVVLLSIALIVISSAPAPAAEGDYPSRYRLRWRNNTGQIWTDEHSSCSSVVQCRLFDYLFMWEVPYSMHSLDDPRTPNMQGVHEMELFFDGEPYSPYEEAYWCDLYEPWSHSIFVMPSGFYYEGNPASGGEWSYGLQGWNIIRNTLYEVQNNCSPTRAPISNAAYPTNGRHFTNSQILHCHSPGTCDASATGGSASWVDNTNRLKPQVGQAPQIYSWYTSLDEDFSLEDLPGTYPNGPRVISGSTATRKCDSTRHDGSCYWNIRAGSATAYATLYHNFTPPSEARTTTVYNEWVVRCPSSQNTLDCQIRLYWSGYNSDYSVQLFRQNSSFFTIPRSTTGWYIIGLYTTSPTQTPVRWRFAVQGNQGVDYDADTHSQWYCQGIITSGNCQG